MHLQHGKLIRRQALERLHFAKGLWQGFMDSIENFSGQFEIIKAVSPLMSNPNSNWTVLAAIPHDDDEDDVIFTPIYNASENGHLEIVKFLAPLSDNLGPELLQELEDIGMTEDHPLVLKYLRSIMESN